MFKKITSFIALSSLALMLMLPLGNAVAPQNPVIQKITSAIAVHAVLAAPDADLLAAKASTTILFTDNKSTIIGWYVAIFTVLIICVIALSALYFAKRKSAGLFGGGGRRRR